MAQESSKIIKNTTYFTGAMIFQKVLSFIYFWYISNNLFSDHLGKYVWALSFTTIFSILIDLGLSQVLTREASKNKEEANRYLKNILGIKIPLAILALVLVWVIVALTKEDYLVRLLVYLASAIMVFDSFTLSFYAIFRARQNLRFESIGAVIFQIINFSLGFAFLKITGDVKFLIVALISASLFNLLFSIVLLKIKLGYSLKPVWHNKTVKYLLKIVPSFALAGIFIKLYNTTDAVILGYLTDDSAVGFYSIPAKAVFALQNIIPGAFAAIIFPAFSSYYVTSKVLLRKAFERAVFYLAVISLPISFGLLALVEEVLQVLWPSYVDVALSFKIMGLAMPFVFISFATGSLLNACDRQRNATINRGIITGFSIVVNIILIPYLSYLGAAIAFLSTNVLLFILDWIWANKITDFNKKYLLSILFKSLLASVIMFVLIYFLKTSFSLFFLVILGVIIYFICLYILRVFSFKEIKTFKNSFLK